VALPLPSSSPLAISIVYPRAHPAVRAAAVACDVAPPSPWALLALPGPSAAVLGWRALPQSYNSERSAVSAMRATIGERASCASLGVNPARRVGCSWACPDSVEPASSCRMRQRGRGEERSRQSPPRRSRRAFSPISLSHHWV